MTTSTQRKKMDLFEWPQLQDPFAMAVLAEDLDVLEIPVPSGSWEDYFPSELFDGNINSNPRQSCSGASTQSGESNEYTQSPSEAGSNESNIPKLAKSAGRPRYPLQTGRDTNMNRIQRRRTQNRNSQRIYRQRRMEERNTFEGRAINAEETARNLQVQLSELHSAVSSLKHQIRQLQAENAALRVGYQ